MGPSQRLLRGHFKQINDLILINSALVYEEVCAARIVAVDKQMGVMEDHCLT